MTPLWQLFGRLHPLVLHLPIGLAFGWITLEILCARGLVSRRAVGVFGWATALFAVLTAAAGWVLSHEEGYGGEVLERHEWLGIAVAVLALAAALLHPITGAGARLALYRAALAGACMLLVPAGHLGSTLTHGANWLAGPREARTPEPIVDGEPAPREVESVSSGEESEVESSPESTYASRVAPVLAARCTGCHGEEKKKGGLRLHGPEAIAAGGDDGPVIVPGDAAASLLVQRVRLPLEHEDHMPPEGKPQPTAEEVALLAAWVQAGAPFEGAVELAPPSVEPAAPTPEAESAARPAGPAPPDERALAALGIALVHAEPIAPDSDLLWIEVAAVAPSIDDTELARLLEPLLANVAELCLARSAITDASLALVARCPRLARLDLRATAVTAAGLASLAGHPALEKLVLAQTRLDDTALETLLTLPALETLVLWRAGFSEEALARLRAARPELTLLAGDEAPADAVETEGELAFTSDRPLPGGETVPAGLAPVNTTCPVSGSPVNPEYAIVFEGRVVGFCCPNCPKDFWADPAAYEGKLP